VNWSLVYPDSRPTLQRQCPSGIVKKFEGAVVQVTLIDGGDFQRNLLSLSLTNTSNNLTRDGFKSPWNKLPGGRGGDSALDVCATEVKGPSFSVANHWGVTIAAEMEIFKKWSGYFEMHTNTQTFIIKFFMFFRVALPVWDYRNAETSRAWGIIHPWNYPCISASVHGILGYSRIFGFEHVLGRWLLILEGVSTILRLWNMDPDLPSFRWHQSSLWWWTVTHWQLEDELLFSRRIFWTNNFFLI